MRSRSESAALYAKTWAFSWNYWRQHPKLFWGVFAMTCLMIAADVVSPWLAGSIVDAIVVDASASTALWAVAGYVGIMALFHGSKHITEQLWIRLAPMCMEQIVNDAFQRVQRFSSDWHANSFAGAVVRKITRGKWGFDLYGDTLLWGVFPAAVILIGCTLALAIQWWQVGLFVGVTGAIYVVVSVMMAVHWIGPANQQQVAQDSKISGLLADALGCNAVVKAFGSEAREDRRIAKAARLWHLRARRSLGRAVGSGGFQSIMVTIMMAGALSLAIWLWHVGQATSGDIVVIMSTIHVVNAYLRFVGQHAEHLQKSVNEMEDVIRFMDQEIAVRDVPGAPPFQAAVNDSQEGGGAKGGEIRFEGVTFRYGGQVDPLYRDFDLAIKPGERVGLVGPSGSGKSTFVKLLQRLYDLNDGRIVIDGQDIALVQQSSLRRALAMVPQEPVLFHRSLAENIAYGRPGAGRAAIEAAAREALAHDFIMRLPQGYDTLVGERGVKLSGGERQRVAIARALLADAPVLILDEATAALDSIAEAEIQRALGRLMAGRTTLVVAHRLATVQGMDRILVFNQGRIVEEGSHAALLQREGGHYRALFEEQALGLMDGLDASQKAALLAGQAPAIEAHLKNGAA
ncbi:MAG: ABC transporter ATP-binding protein [Alphaproteobacteria bacterium]|nr:ABC transporter ATP-binding protein [Alphaproteobacteria bacterium SS10]